MKIDLFTFIAQIINFIILVVLLYYFLYKKIIQAIDQKEKTIRAEYEEAEKNKKLAIEEKEHYDRSIKEFEVKKEELLSQAKEETKQKKEELLHMVQNAVDQKKKNWEQNLEREKRDFLEELERKIGVEVYATTQFLLKDLSNVDLHKQIYSRFIQILENLSVEQRQAFQNAYQSRKKKAIEIASSYEISKEEQEKIVHLFESFLQEKPHVTFESDSAITLGIQIQIDGYSFKWTSDDYLEKIVEKFEKEINQKNG